MIIFDLDGTLADCEHRRHFVDPVKYDSTNYYCNLCYNGTAHPIRPCSNCSFKPDWKSFHKACDKDEPITSTIHMLEYIGEAKEYGSDTPWVDYDDVEIWSERCESVRKKTEEWIFKNIRHFNSNNLKLKMRPIGDSTPDDVLKEKWLDETLAEGKKINYVFDDRPKVIRMWRRRGIFVFNCCQRDEKFN